MCVVVAAGGGGACCVVWAGFDPPTCIGTPIGFRLMIGPFGVLVPPTAASIPTGPRLIIGAGAA